MKRIRSYTVPAEQNNSSVKELLTNQFCLSAGMVRRLKLMSNGIMCNGQHVHVTKKVTTGDRLSVLLESESACSENIVPVKGELNIIFEDEDILVLNKPPGVPIHPSQGHFADSLANHVMWYYRNKGENFVFRPVNRLDRGTSGLLCVAKNAHIQDRLSLQLQNNQLKRTYFAVVCGQVLPEQGTIDAPIRRTSDSTIKREVGQGGAQAITHYQTLAHHNTYTLLQISLETGRTHQIRVHFSHMGHPLVGDFLYGTELPDLNGHALHSGILKFVHPISNEQLSFETTLPEYMQNLMNQSVDLITKR